MSRILIGHKPRNVIFSYLFRKWFWFVISGLCVLVVYLRLQFINLPLLNAHYFRQTQTATVARNFYLDGIDIFHPRIDIAGIGKEQTLVLEFPFYQTMVAFIARFVGYSDALGRLVSVFWGILGGVYLALLVQKSLKSKSITIASLVFYFFSPLNIFYQQSFMIESTVVTLHIMSLYYWYTYLEKKNYSSLFLFQIYTTLACLQKSVYGPFLLLTLLGVTVYKFGLKSMFQKKYILPFILPVVLFILWQRYVDITNIANGNPYFATSSKGQQMWNFGTLADRFIWDNWRIRFLMAFNSMTKLFFIPFFIGIISFFIAWKKKYGMFFIWFLSQLLYYVIFFRIQSHEYYFMVIIPVISVIAAMGVVSTLNLLKGYLPESIQKYFFLFLFLGVQFIFIFKGTLNSLGYFYIDRVMLQKLANINVHLDEKGPVLFLLPEYDWNSVYTYYTGRKGIAFGFVQVNENTFRTFKSQGYSYAVFDGIKFLSEKNPSLASYVATSSSFISDKEIGFLKL